MAAKADRPLEVINIRLYKGDYEQMGILFPKMKAGPAIRLLVSNFIERQKASIAPLDIELPLEIIDEVLS
jgi:hypothetical protein